jgi:hypothetical protein
MNIYRVWHSFLLGAVLAALFSPAAEAAILYRETFGRPDPATGNQGTVNWDWVRFNATGAVGNLTNGVSSDGVGKPTDMVNTASAGPNADNTFNAYAEGWSYMDGTQRLTLTNEYSFDPSLASPPVCFGWWQGAAYNESSAPGANQAKVAIRVGGAWYVSAQSFVNTPVTGGANFGSVDPNVPGAEYKSLLFDPAAANWLTLAFDGDYDNTANTATASTVALSIGAPAGAALSGPVTAFGLYRDATGQNFRFDNFTIFEGVPEPGSLALAAMSLAAMLGVRRRHA